MTTMSGTLHEGAWAFHVTGQVQGVGFRPFVYRLATSLGLTGSVRNHTRGVTVELFGPAQAIDAFERRLWAEQPAMASIDRVAREPIGGASAPTAFAIEASERGDDVRGRVTVDGATCAECLAELFDPANRRHRHPLINCTNCGPRYTIVRDLPYDRPLTTMDGFPMCEACRAEYLDPTNRRFHAQPICCNECGPRLTLVDARGPVAGDPIDAAASLLRAGRIVAMKGIGGYHLVVDAGNDEAVLRLRAGKRRDHKPFALMAPTPAEAERLVALSPEARRAIEGSAAPIVLAPRRRDTEALAPVAGSVAPGLTDLGVMLPHTPMQHLLARAFGGPLVMTSANLSDDPLVSEDGDAAERLRGVADAWLAHDRPIHRAVDDSILRDMPSGLVPFRRARGMAPTPIRLPIGADAPGLCVGADLKGCIAVVRGDDAVLSHHLGDLSHTLAFTRCRAAIDDLLALYDVRPAWIACDAHPGYISRRLAAALARGLGCPIIDVQHHHAHFASLLAERGVDGPAVGVICDGVGYGEDGSAWGGEILVGDLRSVRRAARLRPLRLPGGDAAATSTGRCGVSWLVDAIGADAARGAFGKRMLPDDAEREAVLAMLASDRHCPPSSGVGRLFDAAASLLGVCDRNHHEAQSAMALEAAADRSDASSLDESLLAIVEEGDRIELDHRPLLRRLVHGLERGESVPTLARRFHEAIANGFAHAAIRIARRAGIARIGFSGGVFCNAILTQRVRSIVLHEGLDVLTHVQVPPNDGGIALGQAAVAAARRASHQIASLGAPPCV